MEALRKDTPIAFHSRSVSWKLAGCGAKRIRDFSRFKMLFEGKGPPAISSHCFLLSLLSPYMTTNEGSYASIRCRISWSLSCRNLCLSIGTVRFWAARPDNSMRQVSPSPMRPHDRADTHEASQDSYPNHNKPRGAV